MYKSYLNLLKVAWYGLSLCMSPRFYLIPICKMELESKGLIHLIMPSTLNNMSKQNPDLVILNQLFVGVQRYEVHWFEKSFLLNQSINILLCLHKCNFYKYFTDVIHHPWGNHGVPLFPKTMVWICGRRLGNELDLW